MHFRRHRHPRDARDAKGAREKRDLRKGLCPGSAQLINSSYFTFYGCSVAALPLKSFQQSIKTGLNAAMQMLLKFITHTQFGPRLLNFITHAQRDSTEFVQFLKVTSPYNSPQSLKNSHTSLMILKLQSFEVRLFMKFRCCSS